jgi:exopolysaccharide biosynthesis protein
MILLLVSICPACRAAPATRPCAGVSYREEIRQSPPMRLFMVSIDLAQSGLRLQVAREPLAEQASPWNCLLRPTSELAAREGFAVAVNGDFFAARDKMRFGGRDFAYFRNNHAYTIGPAMSGGVLWNKGKKEWCALVVHKSGKVSIGSALPLPEDAEQVVGGNMLLVVNGKAVAGDKMLAPRTAAGLDREGKRLILLVVDGRRQGWSVGMTTGELAQEMMKLGCWNAINLDGGGSTTLAMRDLGSGRMEVVNRPSDGNDLPIPLSMERSVANVLGVKMEQ